MNGAVHYAKAILDFAGDEYKDCLAIGLNGYLDAGTEIHEVEIWYLSQANLGKPKRLGNDSLSVLWNRDELEHLIADCILTDDEREELARSAEDRIDRNLRTLNQSMRDTMNLSVSSRVPLVCGMIMAGLGVRGEVEPLPVSALKGARYDESDGSVLMRKIESFLKAKRLPEDKRELVLRILRPTFTASSLQRNPKEDGGSEMAETPLRTLYREVSRDIVPFVNPEKNGYLDFTGKLFNVLTDWVDIPDGGENDVVLTPRYVTDLMARLCRVGMNDYVWDYALGTAGFLVSAMRLMLEDAQRIEDIDERHQKELSIRANQLLGVEMRDDIYMLAVLNMVLMGDGSSNLVCGDSLKWGGTYEQGEHKGEKFPATVFLLNPPYSAPGKGFVFAERAMSRMGVGGRAAILIQENAGSGQGLPYTKRILEKHSLRAVIKMADIFKGKAGVDTAIYVFDCGVPHDNASEVVFIDMSNDGYTRQNKRKASSATNLKNTDHARERYEEVVDIILGRKRKTKYYQSGREVIRDCISLTGSDWIVQQHKSSEIIPTSADFTEVLEDYLSWKAEEIRDFHLEPNQSMEMIDSEPHRCGEVEPFKVSALFDVEASKKTPRAVALSRQGDYPYLTTSNMNNAVSGHGALWTEEGGVITVDSATNGGAFWQERRFTASEHVEKLVPKFDISESIALYIVACLKAIRDAKGYSFANKRNKAVIRDELLMLPIKVDEDNRPVLDMEKQFHPNGYIPDWDYMSRYVRYHVYLHICSFESALLDCLNRRISAAGLPYAALMPALQSALKVNT